MKTVPTLEDLSAADSSSVAARLLKIIRVSRGGRPKQIRLDAELGKDLGIDGDDAVEFFDALRHEFRIDFSALQWQRHFGPEGGLTPFHMLSPSWWRRRLLPITVAELLEAARTRQWRYPYAETSGNPA